MWIEDLEGNLINLANASKVVVSNMTVEGIDPEPVWWCAVTFEHTPKPGILYVGSEGNAKQARSYLRDRISLQGGYLMTRMIYFEGEDADPMKDVDPVALAEKIRAAQIQTKENEARAALFTAASDRPDLI